MPFASALLATTLGRMIPRYRTFGQWAEIYRQVIAGRPVSDKTKANRNCAVTHLVEELGDRTLAAIRPHEIAAIIQRIGKLHPNCAKRLLFEVRDMFNEAINYGWLDRNPAQPIRAPRTKVQRKRLTLEQWRKIHDHAKAAMPPWVARMLVLALVSGQRRSDLEKMRFSDVWDGHLHIEQAKTGTRLALPLDLRLEGIGISLGEAIEDCRAYAVGDEFLLRKHNGQRLVEASLSARFEEAREAALPDLASEAHPPSLHECRSLSERLYRAQGINTMILLGHKHQSMTDLYNDDRGLSSGQWRTLSLTS